MSAEGCEELAGLPVFAAARQLDRDQARHPDTAQQPRHLDFDVGDADEPDDVGRLARPVGLPRIQPQRCLDAAAGESDEVVEDVIAEHQDPVARADAGSGDQKECGEWFFGKCQRAVAGREGNDTCRGLARG